MANKKLSLKSPWAAPSRKPAAKKTPRKPRDNPRVPCGTVSAKHNKFVGATVFIDGAERKIIGCAMSPDGKTPQYATRKPGSTGTRYTPKAKRAIRDLKYRKPEAVKLVKQSKTGTKTSEALIKKFEKRYAKKPAAKKTTKKTAPKKTSTGARKPKKKLFGAALAAYNKKRGK